MAIVGAAIDLTAAANFSQNGTFACRTPVWQLGDNLYAIGLDQTDVDAIGIWKSTDGGGTWDHMDTGGQPTNASIYSTLLESDQMYVLAGPRRDQADLAIRLFQFNCSTDTWSSIATGDTAHWVSGLFRNGDGDLVGVWSKFNDGSLYAGPLGAGLDIRAAVPGTPDMSGWTSYGCVDSDGRVHVFFQEDYPSTQCWHIAIDPGNTLSTPVMIPGEILGGAVAAPGLVAVSAVSSGDGVVIIGTPIDAPVFSAVTVDGTNSPDAVNLSYDPENDSYAYLSLHSSLTIIALGLSPDLADWTLSDVYDISSDTTPPGLSVADGIFPPGLWYDQGGNGDILISSCYRDIDIPGLFVAGFYVGSFPALDEISNYFL